MSTDDSHGNECVCGSGDVCTLHDTARRRPVAAYVAFGPGPGVANVSKTVRSHPSVLIDLDRDNEVVGVEVIGPLGPPRVERPPYASTKTEESAGE